MLTRIAITAPDNCDSSEWIFLTIKGFKKKCSCIVIQLAGCSQKHNYSAV